MFFNKKNVIYNTFLYIFFRIHKYLFFKEIINNKFIDYKHN